MCYVKKKVYFSIEHFQKIPTTTENKKNSNDSSETRSNNSHLFKTQSENINHIINPLKIVIFQINFSWITIFSYTIYFVGFWYIIFSFIFRVYYIILYQLIWEIINKGCPWANSFDPLWTTDIEMEFWQRKVTKKFWSFEMIWLFKEKLKNLKSQLC